MHPWVRLIWCVCTLRRQEFLPKGLLFVIHVGQMAPPDIAGRVKYGLCMYFAIYWQLIAGWTLWQSQYCTILEGQDERVSSPYSQERYTSHYVWESVVCTWLCWYITMALSHCRYVGVQKYWKWNCRQDPSAKLTLIWGSEHESLDIWDVMHTVEWFFKAPGHWLPAIML